MTKNPTRPWNVITTTPITMMIERTIEPITREISRSKKARTLTPIGPSTSPAEICRNGEKKVRNNKSIEKKSAVAAIRSRIITVRWRQPAPYHQDSIPTINMFLLYDNHPFCPRVLDRLRLRNSLSHSIPSLENCPTQTRLTTGEHLGRQLLRRLQSNFPRPYLVAA